MRGLYAIVDPEQCAGRDPLFVAERVLEGGATVLQLRAKRLSDPDFVALGTRLHALTRKFSVPLFVNDRVALAAAIAAEGVHVGQGDASIEAVRAQLGARVLVGVSTHSLAQARDAEARGADLIGFGPVFETTSKESPDPPVGLSGLREVCSAVRIPVAAIGGITLQEARGVRQAGAALAAVISALGRAEDPARAARELCAAWLEEADPR